MFSNEIIPKPERKLLLIFSLALFIFSFASLSAYTIKEEIERNAYFKKQAEDEAKGLGSFSGPYCFPDKHPQFLLLNLLLAGLIFVTLFSARIQIFSVFFSGYLISRFAFWFYDTQKMLSNNEFFEPQGLNNFFHKATNFDLLTLSTLSLLCFWQISILLRILIKTTQKEQNLP